MPHVSITERFVKSLKPPKSGYDLYFDAQLRGFGVRITASGVIAFVLNYTLEGRDRRSTIGRWPELSAQAAREEALTIRQGIHNGVDPLAQKQAKLEEPCVKELAEEYTASKDFADKSPASVRNDRQMLANIILPRLGRFRVRAVQRRDVESLHGSLRSTPYRANRVLALLSTMFTLALQRRYCDENPVKGVNRYREEPRQKWLSFDELRMLEKALLAYPDQEAANAIRLLIVTGAREMEVLRADWSQFELRRGVWTKPSHHVKERKTEHVPLNRAALMILSTMHETRKGAYLFPGMNGARTTIRRPWEAVCRAAGFVRERTILGKRGRPLTRYSPTIRIHDLRHTFCSHLVSQGQSLYAIGRLVGHTQPSTTARYAHVNDKALREASNAVTFLVDASFDPV